MIFNPSASHTSGARTLAAVAFCALVVCACTAPQTRHLLDTTPAALPNEVMLGEVPFFPQQEYYCGPAALAMVMNYYGRDVTPAALAETVYVPELKGSLQAEMLGATRRRGMLGYVLSGELQALLAEVTAGHPVVVLQNLGVSWYPAWHYAVAIGYDLKAREIILHSGENRRYRMPLSTFEYTWARSDYWALTALPPGVLPHENRPLRTLEAISALEQAGQTRPAQQAYAAAVERWPDNLIAHMGLGNTRYALGEIEAAMRAFLAAARAHPESATAHNNLAVTLNKLGCEDAARQAAHRAVELGRDETVYAQTLAQIRETTADQSTSQGCPAIVVTAR